MSKERQQAAEALRRSIKARIPHPYITGQGLEADENAAGDTTADDSAGDTTASDEAQAHPTSDSTLDTGHPPRGTEDSGSDG